MSERRDVLTFSGKQILFFPEVRVVAREKARLDLTIGQRSVIVRFLLKNHDVFPAARMKRRAADPPVLL
jgi:hypothetical protein